MAEARLAIEGLTKRFGCGVASAAPSAPGVIRGVSAVFAPARAARSRVGLVQRAGMLRERKRRLAIILVEHDMEAVFALADRVAVPVSGRVIACEAPQKIRANDACQACLGEQEAMHG
jgi:hypothetical protein